MSSFRKEARSALDEKDFDRAVSVCDYGLEVDKNDYLLLVFRGLAMKNMGNYKQAIESYERATKASPEQLLAWKGLLEVLNKVSLYERKQELMGRTLLTLRQLSEGQSEKRTLWLLYIDLLQTSKRTKDAIKELHEYSCEYKDDDTKERICALWEEWEEAEIKSRTEKERFRISADPIEVTTRKVTSQVYSESALTDLLIESNDMEKSFNRLEVFCPEKHSVLFEKLTVELKLCNANAAKRYLDSLDVERLEECSREVLEFLNDPYCKYALGNKSKLMGASGLFQTFVYCWYLVDTLQYAESIRVITAVLSKFEGKRGKALKKLLAKSFFETDSITESITLLQELRGDVEYFNMLIKAYDRIGSHEQAAELLEKGTKERAWQLYKAHMYDELSCEVEILKDGKDCEYLVLKGLALWHCGREEEKEGCLQLWKKALSEREDEFALAHFYSGKYYAELGKLHLAVLSLEKALQLDPQQLTFGLELSKVYLRQEKWNEAFALMKRFQGKRHWQRFFHMGLAMERLEDWGEAVVYFQEALKEAGTGKDYTMDILRHLSVCFMRNGAWMSALRAYKKLELSEEESESLHTCLGLFELYVREEEKLFVAHELIPRGHRRVLLYCIRRLIRAALDAFDDVVLGKLKEERFEVTLEWNDEEIHLLVECLEMLPLQVSLSAELLETLPRSVTKNAKELQILESLLVGKDKLECLDEDETDEVTKLLNEAIVEDSLEKYERVCALDTSQGLAWMGRYVITQETSFLLCALEWLKDMEWIEFSLKELRRRSVCVESNEELVVMALERYCCCVKVYGRRNGEWAFRWLGKLLEKNLLLEEALHAYEDAKDVKAINRVKVLLGQATGDMNLPMNQLADHFQNEDDNMEAMMTRLPEQETLMFKLSMQVLADSVSGPISRQQLLSNSKHPFHHWQAVKMLYFVNSSDPSAAVLEHFKESTGLLSLYIALDILRAFPSDEFLREAVKERKHTWQDVYQGERPCSRIGKQLFKFILEAL